MSSDTIIRAQGLGKKYVVGHRRVENVPTLRDAIVRSTKNFVRTTGDVLRGRPVVAGDELEDFWALKDLNFEIRRGEVVGIIGKNGAGKSTLLKILSRITEPSAGRVEIRGRVASLLEVGTGFHPELSGRENIFLNGAILGMSGVEIKRKFDEIVAFSEVEKFIDTPVKRYSSGMYVRLAFAVAAHLEPEILIVDEVLAVGDADFQKKCLGKMQDVAGHGRTVLFVSHNVSAIQSLCNTGILLEAGQLSLRGDTASVTQAYAAKGVVSSSFSDRNPKGATRAWIQAVDLEATSQRLLLRMQVYSRSAKRIILNVRLRDQVGSPVGMASAGGYNPDEMVALSPGSQMISVEVALPTLANGLFRVDLDLEEPYNSYLDRVVDQLTFEVIRNMASAHGRVLGLNWQVGAIELPISIARDRPR